MKFLAIIQWTWNYFPKHLKNSQAYQHKGLLFSVLKGISSREAPVIKSKTIWLIFVVEMSQYCLFSPQTDVPVLVKNQINGCCKKKKKEKGVTQNPWFNNQSYYTLITFHIFIFSGWEI